VRIDLDDGQWAELRERPTTNQLNIVRRALIRFAEDRETGPDLFLAYVEAYVSDWHVLADGAAVPLASAGDVDDVIIQRIAYEASELYKGRPDPKASGARSGSSSSAKRSAKVG
jgi:hypothetical protein